MDFTLCKHLLDLDGPVMVTGHTGFKGSWLTLLLRYLGVETVGLSLFPEENSLFDRANRIGSIPESFIDLRDYAKVSNFIKKHNPQAIIHLAAQPLVLDSYVSPRETFEINTAGTVNILDAAFKNKSVEAIVVATTDKVYTNNNSGQAFIESDPLSGKDPYSASKVGAEAAISAWQQISRLNNGPRIIAVRAGNVVGGGDFARDRLLPDIIRGAMARRPIQIRNSESTRPWQHALDPISGYVLALERALQGNAMPSLNFGPNETSLSVKEVSSIASKSWPDSMTFNFLDEIKNSNFEAKALQLDSSLARKTLNWAPVWSQEDAIRSTMQWWDSVLNMKIKPEDACQKDIERLF